MESYKSSIRKVFSIIFNWKIYPGIIRSAKPSESRVDSVAHATLHKDDSIENEYIMSAEYLQQEAYHGSSMSYQVAQILLWSFIAILIAPILVIVNILFQFRDSKYSWAAITGCVFFITSLIFYFLRTSKELDESYSAQWGMKTRDTAQEVQNRIYAKDRNAKFRTTHLADMHGLQTIPENQSPRSLGNMRHQMNEKFVAAMKDMTSETRVKLNIYLIISGALSIIPYCAAQHYYNNPTSFSEATNHLVLLSKALVVIIMYTTVLYQTKFWIEELERERSCIMRGWDIVN
ncbi:uncharacterized protein EAF02_010940 [Botrytis sinoallii]|uniref:uncharacterized protein n=1 Tax=Botrytis sinoallii TaxID=1463999 RepID=UPI001901F4A7|nr:uncharacterized protein EAF02_010940 [Botrytis sinoallii]KAF7859492.1 hypothetical protein EAF02_010940 [Botrytis sinoallii]